MSQPVQDRLAMLRVLRDLSKSSRVTREEAQRLNEATDILFDELKGLPFDTDDVEDARAYEDEAKKRM